MIIKKIKKLSLVTCLVLTSSAFSADSINDAFSNAKVSGSINAYGIATDAKGGTADSGFSASTILLSYETDTFNNFNAKIGFIAGTVMSEEENDDASESFVNDALMTEAYIKYSNDFASFSLGRQEIGLEWLGDYNESALLELTSIPDTSVVVAFVDKQAAAAEDEITEFAKINGDKGLYVVDAKYTGINRLELNPYYYSAPDLADFYGLKASYTSSLFGLTAQYATSDEDTQSDGSIACAELTSEIAGLGFSAGYITTDSKVGAASISTFDDNLSPFDNGEKVYSANADTVYASASYDIAGLGFGVLYGETQFDTNSEVNELNFTVDYSFTDDFSMSLLYVNYDLESSSAKDYKEYVATLTYSF